MCRTTEPAEPKPKEIESLSNSTENVYENIKSPAESEASKKPVEVDLKRIPVTADNVTPLLNGSFKRKNVPSSPGKVGVFS